MKYEFVVTEADADRRLDRFVAAQFDQAPTGLVRRLLRQKKIKVNGARPEANRRLAAGDVVVVHHVARGSAQDPSAGTAFEPRRFDGPPIEILGEHDGFLFVNKPAGVACSDDGRDTRALARWLENELASRIASGAVRPEACHRLDRDTTGVVAIALGAAAFDRFRRALEAGRVEKSYEVVVHGRPTAPHFVVENPLARRRDARADEARMIDGAGTPDAIEARTEFELLVSAEELSLLVARPVTGRTHQIRAHCRIMGLPVVGDPRYGDAARDAAMDAGNGQLLHARALQIEDLDAITAPWPGDRIAWRRAHGL